MDEAEVEEVIHLVDRQKKRLHFAGSLMHVQPACKELRQMPLFQGLNDQDFAKVHKHSFANILFLFAFPEKAQPPDLHDDVLLVLSGIIACALALSTRFAFLLTLSTNSHCLG